MGSCKNKRLIGPYLDGQLGECKWLEEHIAECSECLAEYETVQRLSFLAEKADYSPPESSYWKKFGTRVIARIAARPQPKRYPRIFEAIFANKLALRLVTPLLVVLIVVLAVRIYLPFSEMASVQQIASTDGGIPPEPLVSITEPANLPEPIAAIESDIYPIAETAVREQPQEQVVEEVVSNDDISSEPSAALINNLIDEYIRSRNLQTSLTKLTSPDNDLWADISRDYKYRVFDTDHVLRFQILSGSNPSLAPLSFYREAAGKFFAPEISGSRNQFEQNITNRWGYASGDDNYNEDRQRHLELEFDLSREK